MKIKAFTLAEVLITLGIIGIVAAMTLPIIVGKYQERVLVTAAQKAYSIMSNALTKWNAEHEVVGEYVSLFTSAQSAELNKELAKVLNDTENYTPGKY